MMNRGEKSYSFKNFFCNFFDPLGITLELYGHHWLCEYPVDQKRILLKLWEAKM